MKVNDNTESLSFCCSGVLDSRFCLALIAFFRRLSFLFFSLLIPLLVCVSCKQLSLTIVYQPYLDAFAQTIVGLFSVM